ncbi:MAG TPA: tRNA uridine-5-carboxymethylaminomethyl(34) synthesis GTPase MnmE [Xanthobacteraceae bacterium]|nr:tRNA uridine-5-carboxymethylaminomethyl(34) synthesis GTPase MnmE [Xanthobacteraceae bacterium]
MSPARDTIFALSSGRPPAAIAVVRISGPRARLALEALSGRLPQPRQASLARLRDPDSGESLDEALALWFPSPRSETGEDMAELQLHGGRAVIAAVLAALGRLPEFRPAEAGEFTRRAFENGRLDLTAVEGLADLIGAETEAQRRQAFRQLKGMLGERAETWRARLVQALALVEAGIDFSDEADVPDELIRPALDIARELHDEIADALAQAGRGERLRDGLVVAIAGPPNAGKSTLLNRIAKREAAIVSPFAGTTRDVIEVHLDLGGYPVTLLDTAGIRESEDPIEQEGVRRARERAAAADLVLWVTEAGRPVTEFPRFSGPSAHEELEGRPLADMAAGPLGTRYAISSTRPLAEPSQLPTNAKPVAEDPPVWVIRNKIDLVLHQRNEDIFTNEHKFISISASSGIGIDGLLGRLAEYVQRFFGVESGLITRERHRSQLAAAKSALERALSESSGREELVAEELRLAARALGRLTGKVDVEDVLDVIFRDFCIGK